MFKKLVKPFAMQFATRLRAIADAHEHHGYDHRKPELERNQHLTVAWALRSVAMAVDEVYE